MMTKLKLFLINNFRLVLGGVTLALVLIVIVVLVGINSNPAQQVNDTDTNSDTGPLYTTISSQIRDLSTSNPFLEIIEPVEDISTQELVNEYPIAPEVLINNYRVFPINDRYQYYQLPIDAIDPDLNAYIFNTIPDLELLSNEFDIIGYQGVIYDTLNDTWDVPQTPARDLWVIQINNEVKWMYNSNNTLQISDPFFQNPTQAAYTNLRQNYFVVDIHFLTDSKYIIETQVRDNNTFEFATHLFVIDLETYDGSSFDSRFVSLSAIPNAVRSDLNNALREATTDTLLNLVGDEDTDFVDVVELSIYTLNEDTLLIKSQFINVDFWIVDLTQNVIQSRLVEDFNIPAEESGWIGTECYDQKCYIYNPISQTISTVSENNSQIEVVIQPVRISGLDQINTRELLRSSIAHDGLIDRMYTYNQNEDVHTIDYLGQQRELRIVE